MSISAKGKPKSEETKLKIAIAATGRLSSLKCIPRSEATRLKISDTLKQRKLKQVA